jgi:hypothetical protein
MKNYLAIFLGMTTAPKVLEFRSMEEGKRKQIEASGMKGWGDWMKTHQASIVNTGGPLGKTKSIGPKGISDTKNDMTGFLVVKAESQEAAAKLFENHPHFSIFPGDSVELMECLPIPGQH